MSEEMAETPSSPAVEEIVEEAETEESVISDSQPEAEPTAEVEESHPQVDEESSEPSPETEVEAVTKALAENAEPGETPAPEKSVEEAPETPEQPTPEQSDDLDLYAEPEGLKPKAQERFRSLVDNNKKVTGELEQAKTAMAEIHKTVESSGMSPEEFGQMISYAQFANSPSKEDHEYAFKLIKAEYERMAVKVGEEVEGLDLFADFPDIKEKVDGYELSREDAMEIVNSRKQLLQTQQNQTLQTQASNEADDKARSIEDVKSFMTGMEKTDIDFKSKESILLEQVEEIRKNYPVSQWPVVVRQLYYNLGRMGSKTKQEKKAGDNAPLKSTPNSGGASAPQSALDAIKFALNQ